MTGVQTCALPILFGEVEVDTADDVVRNWEQIKQQEKQLGSLMDGLPANLPGLLYVPKLFRKAASLDGAPTATGTDLVTAATARADADAGPAARTRSLVLQRSPQRRAQHVQTAAQAQRRERQR